MKNAPLVSLVIAVKNEEKNLPRLLESCQRQQYRPIEIIVVDNHSTDGTCDEAKRYNVRLFTKGPERSAQRNFGAEHARGEYVYFLDADMEVPSNVVRECVGVFHEHSDTGGVIVPEISVGTTFWAKAKGLERSSYVGDDTIEAARFFTKHAFVEVGGYDVAMVAGEDWDLSNRVRARYPIHRTTTKVIHHEGKLRLRHQLHKKYYYGQHMTAYLKHNAVNVQQGSLLFRKSYFKNWRAFICQPILTCGFIVMRTLELTAGVAGIMKSKFSRKNKE